MELHFLYYNVMEVYERYKSDVQSGDKYKLYVATYSGLNDSLSWLHEAEWASIITQRDIIWFIWHLR